MILQSYVFENECNATFRPIGSRDRGKVGNILCIDEFSSILCVSQSVAGYVGTPELLRVMVTNTGDGCTNGEMVRVQMATEISSDRSELYYNDPLYGNDQWVPQVFTFWIARITVQLHIPSRVQCVCRLYPRRMMTHPSTRGCKFAQQSPAANTCRRPLGHRRKCRRQEVPRSHQLLIVRPISLQLVALQMGFHPLFPLILPGTSLPTFSWETSRHLRDRGLV